METKDDRREEELAGAVGEEAAELVLNPYERMDEPGGEGRAAGGPVELETLPAGELLPDAPDEEQLAAENAKLKAILEAVVYITDEPLTVDQIAAALHQPEARILALLSEVAAEYEEPQHGVAIREVAGGYKMATKAEHHEAVRNFVRSLKPAVKLSLPALETLAVIAYKQPITAPEIMEIRGVQGAGVLKTLLDRKLIGTAGRKNVVGKPILYKTTREFLVQFGLKDLNELPSIKEFEELRRLSMEPEAAAVLSSGTGDAGQGNGEDQAGELEAAEEGAATPASPATPEEIAVPAEPGEQRAERAREAESEKEEGTHGDEESRAAEPAVSPK